MEHFTTFIKIMMMMMMMMMMMIIIIIIRFHLVVKMWEKWITLVCGWINRVCKCNWTLSLHHGLHWIPHLVIGESSPKGSSENKFGNSCFEYLSVDASVDSPLLSSCWNVVTIVSYRCLYIYFLIHFFLFTVISMFRCLNNCFPFELM